MATIIFNAEHVRNYLDTDSDDLVEIEVTISQVNGPYTTSNGISFKPGTHAYEVKARDLQKFQKEIATDEDIGFFNIKNMNFGKMMKSVGEDTGKQIEIIRNESPYKRFEVERGYKFPGIRFCKMLRNLGPVPDSKEVLLKERNKQNELLETLTKLIEKSVAQDNSAILDKLTTVVTSLAKEKK